MHVPQNPLPDSALSSAASRSGLGLRARATVALACLLAATSSCSEPGISHSATDLARDRAAAFFAEDDRTQARSVLAPLVEGADAELEDLVRAAAIELADDRYPEAEAFLERGAALDSKSAAINFMRGQIRRRSGSYEEALPYFRIAAASAPDDLPTQLLLAEVIYELGDVQEAIDIYTAVEAIGIEHAGGWYMVANYRLGRIHMEQGREQEAARYTSRDQELRQAGFTAPHSIEVARGNFGVVRPATPRGTRTEPGKLARYDKEPVSLPGLKETRELFATTVDADRQIDLVAGGPEGLRLALADGQGGYVVRSLTDQPIDLVRVLDLSNDDYLDFVVVSDAKIELYVHDKQKAAWQRSSLAFPNLPSPPLDVVPVDYDHEGDMDLLLVGAFGARVWRNDGAELPDQDGAFVDASEEAGLPRDLAYDWCLTEDFDNDNDVDFLMGGPDGFYLADNRRGGKFADGKSAFPAGTELTARPIVADFDGDARADILVPGSPSTILWRQPAGTYRSEVRASIPVSSEEISALDLDLDGALDLVWADAERLASGRLALGLEHETTFELEPSGTSDARIHFADLDDDCDLDALRLTSQGVEIFEANGGVPGTPVRLLGLRDNRRAVGATVELRAGDVYRRIYWRGDPALLGAGDAEQLDVLRVTFPNGIVMTLLDVPAGCPTAGSAETGGEYLQPEGLTSSCPFLYTWNGTTYEFVSDVIGITPLGLPMAPGVLVPPDHDEYVLIRGDQLVPKDGFLELQFTEELREVTYLDRARLDVIDHPAGTEIFPNERFTLPPFPEAHTHSVRAPHAPLLATGSDGVDWTAQLESADSDHAMPFRRQRPQFAGMTEPWFLELEFDPERTRDAKQLRLLFTGWFSWSDASANMAAARHPRVSFVPPILQVPDPEQGWKDAGGPVGFPAGKTKTMVIDVSEILDREDPRLRVFTTLELYWDAILLATDDDDAELLTTSLEAASAELWERGFSAPLETGRADMPAFFDWDELSQMPRWNQHPGSYTRLGDVLPLLTSVDDRFVIMGSGDALTLRFDAAELPELRAGFVRDYLVYLDGWAKDRDPNTIEALYVEPLPFHGMSAYPYPAPEAFPDDPAHERWRAEWNTRPARTRIAPASPARVQEWIDAQRP